MSKTSQELKKKKLAQEEKAAEAVETRKADVEVQETTASENPETVTEAVAEETTKTRAAKVRGKKYLAAKKKVDVAKYYPLKEAIELVQKTSFSKFDGNIEAHVNVAEAGDLGEIVFPHLKTEAKKVVVLNDTVLAEIKEGKLNFDILIATPATMPKLLPFARTLGPKGLMPNPKSGTLTDDPEGAVKRLSVAKTMVRTEKKAPVVHILVGKVSQSTTELEANVAELISVIKAQKIRKLALCATMGPCVKVEIIK